MTQTIAAITLVLLGACQRGAADPVRGEALELGVPAMAISPVARGEAIANNGPFLRNRSDDTIELREVSAVRARGLGTVVEIDVIELGLRGEPPIPASFYKTYPPVSWHPPSRGCGREELVRVAGHELGPGDEVRLVIKFRILDRAERARIRGWRIVYELDGKTFYQVSPLGIGFDVNRRRPWRPEPDERRCLHLTTRLGRAPAPSGQE